MYGPSVGSVYGPSFLRVIPQLLGTYKTHLKYSTGLIRQQPPLPHTNAHTHSAFEKYFIVFAKHKGQLEFLLSVLRLLFYTKHEKREL